MKKTNIIIIILMLLVLGLSGYIVYDKVLSTETNNNYQDDNNQNEGNQDNDIVLPEWANYLTGFDLVLTESIYDYDTDECNFEKVSISTTNLNKLLTELSTKRLAKSYYGSMPPVGTACSERFKLQYGNNSISLEADGVAWTSDKALDGKFDLDLDDTYYNDDYKQYDGYVYDFDVDFATIINKYRTSK